MRYLTGLGIAILLLGMTAVPANAATPRTPAQPSDFNGDGYVDLAIGVPADEDGAGGVNIIYGSASGLTASGDQYWSQDSPGVKGIAGPSVDADDDERFRVGDSFGNVLASGDFDRDGFADLAIGVPWDQVAGTKYGGGVNVLYGSRHGLTADGDQLWNRENLSLGAEATIVGRGVAAGDLNGDGFPDLAISFSLDHGAVEVVLGGPNGLSAVGATLLSGTSPGFPGELGDQGLGSVLLCADLDGDGFDDLVAAGPNASVAEALGAGAVIVMYGDPLGPDFDRSQVWTQDSPGVAGIAEAGQQFGQAVAAGDFDGDGRADLAIAVRKL